MRKALLFLLVAAPPLAAQSLITISPQQCVWRAGDDPAWAAPLLDETGWQTYSAWKINPSEPRIWVRCHVDLSSLRSAERPALQVTLYAAYQIFADGRLMGTTGNLQSGAFNMDAIRSWQLPGDLSHHVTVALRITFHLVSMVPTGPLPPLEINAGSRELLNYRRSSLILTGVRRNLIPAICFSIIGIIGIFLLGLYLNDRGRRDLQLLSANCIMLAPIYLNYLCVAALLPYSAAANLAGWAAPAIVTNITRTLFFFVLARKRVPLLFWALIGLSVILYPVALTVPFLPPAQALWLDTFRSHQIASVAEFAAILESFAPFAAFLPRKRLTQRMKPLAALCMAWGAIMMSFFTVRFTSANIPGLPDLQARWGNAVADAEAFITLCVLVALLALLFHEQQQTAKDRAVLAGEMRSARSVQQVIIPEVIPSVPGFRIESVYKPAGEVGGDFFQILPTPAGGVLIVIGDVSGKGMPAAMTVSLLVGTVRTLAHYTQSPGEILAAMNQRMLARSNGGFTTCLVVQVDFDGTLTAANAGHLAPYINGRELPLENGLPLGLAAGVEYTEASFQLLPSTQLTLITDGVVEARNSAGKLFGFERTAAISIQSAESIAQAAQTYGQEDDITVLTLTFAPVEVLHV